MEGEEGAIRVGRPWLPYLLLPVLALVLVGLHVHAYRPLSAIDEFQHTDALYRATQFQVVRAGDLARDFTLNLAACRGVELNPIPPCHSSYRHADFPTGGFDTADIHSPVYYLITAAASAPLRFAGMDLVDAGRLAGAGWLAVGLILIWKLAAELGARPAARWAVCVLTACSVNVLEASATINTDATALAGGGIAALAAIRIEQRRWPIWTAPLAGAAAAILKVHNLLGAVAGTAFLVLRRRWLASAALLAGAVLAEASWLAIRHLLSSASLQNVPIIHGEYVDRLTASNVFLALTSMVTPLAVPYTPRFLQHQAVVLITSVQDLLLIAATLGGSMYLERGTRAHSMAVAVTGAMLFGGPFLVVSTFLVRHSYVPAFPRYGLSLVPVAMAVLAVGARTRPLLVVVGSIAAGSLAVVVWYLVRAA